MNRRGFVARLAALAAVPFVPLPKPAPAVPPLVFHPDAFAFAMEPLAPIPRAPWVYNRLDCVVGEVIRVKIPQRFTVKADAAVPFVPMPFTVGHDDA